MKKLSGVIMLASFVALAAIAATTLPGEAATPSAFDNPVLHDDSAAVVAAVDSFHRALSTGDSTAALRMLAADAIILESGSMQTRAEYRSHHLAGDIAFSKAVQDKRGPMKVSVDGATAWTNGTSVTEGTYNGRAINSAGAESMVLSKSGNSWQIRSIHWSSRTKRAATP
ncbi:MAG: nuclear transport factor 2 family protein [Gemmatimonadaceae bacterium]